MCVCVCVCVFYEFFRVVCVLIRSFTRNFSGDLYVSGLVGTSGRREEGGEERERNVRSLQRGGWF